MQGKHIAVWFSCGAASAVAAKLTLEKYGKNNKISILNNPIVEEGEDNQRFLRDVEKWLDVKIEHIISHRFPTQSCEDVWEHERYMSGPVGASCTRALKKVPRQRWERENHPDWTVLGFTAEEQGRADRFRLTERETLLTPLIEEGYTKQDCFDVINNAGLKLPELYLNGLPNANCLGCVKVGSPTYWNWLRVNYPDVFQRRLEQSEKIGAKLVVVKSKRLKLSELDPNAKGHPMKNYDVDCGLFCEEGAWKEKK